MFVGRVGQDNPAWLRDALQSSGDVDPIPHQIAVPLLDHVPDMNSDSELDALIVGKARVASDHAILHLDGAMHRVDDASELDDAAVAGALDDAAVMGGDRRINEIAAERPKARERALLVCPGEPAVTDQICD